MLSPKASVSLSTIRSTGLPGTKEVDCLACRCTGVPKTALAAGAITDKEREVREKRTEVASN
jgi:hypothetical protein